MVALALQTYYRVYDDAGADVIVIRIVAVIIFTPQRIAASIGADDKCITKILEA